MVAAFASSRVQSLQRHLVFPWTEKADSSEPLPHDALSTPFSYHMFIHFHRYVGRKRVDKGLLSLGLSVKLLHSICREEKGCRSIGRVFAFYFTFAVSTLKTDKRGGCFNRTAVE